MTYLFAENQDGEVAIPARKTKSEEVPETLAAGIKGAGCVKGLVPRAAAGWAAPALDSFTAADAPEPAPEAAAEIPRVAGIAPLAAADCAAANARAP
jgi:hypothetical protein